MNKNVSIIINTLNRGHTLENTLKSLFYLDYEYDFEVIVVDSNSTDNTSEILDKYKDNIKIGKCDVHNLSVSRNIGIAMASSNYIAFIDDDAIPEPEWLTNIMKGFNREEVAGVGGPVYDNTGVKFQVKRVISNRLGNDLENITTLISYPNCFSFSSVIGCNSIFRKDYVLSVGGFNEQYDYFLDETELVARLVDAGYCIEYIDNAFIHHKFAKSDIRNDKKVFMDYSKNIKNLIYYINTYKYIINNDILVENEINRVKESVLNGCKNAFKNKLYTKNEYDHAVKSLYIGLEQGKRDLERGYHLFIKNETLNNFKSEFKKFNTYLNKKDRLTICYLVNEYYPDIKGGIARFIYILAREIANKGHQVHVITLTRNNIETVDFEENVWVHRIGVNNYPKNLLEYDTEFNNYNTNRMNVLYSHYNEILNINKKRKVDIVQTPIWDSLGFYAIFDKRFNFVVTLHTSMRTVHGHYEQISDELYFHIELEKYLMKNTKYIVSNSKAIEEKFEEYYGKDICNGKAFLIPHGVEDINSSELKNTRNDDNIEILFVGRLEYRKGIDVIFKCIPDICSKYKNVVFRFVGDDSIYVESIKSTYKNYFLSNYKDYIDKVIFEGYVEEEELINRYFNCDIFISPSRFESFGLIFLEAMIFSKPVIGTNIGGMPEVIENGVSGFLIENENHNDLKVALSKLIEDENLRKTMGANGRKLFESKFTSEIMAYNFINYYRSIIGD